MEIRAVVFDIGGVLEITPPMDVGARWEAELGLPTGAVHDRLGDVFAAGCLGHVTEIGVLDAICEQLEVTTTEADRLMAIMWERYLGVANTELIEWARELRPRHRTGILSNSFVGAREREQQAYGFGDLVDVLVYSHEAGVAKPDPRAYATVCRQLGVRPDQAVLLDDVDANLDGARSAGMLAVGYRTNAQAITELRDLLAD
ncbi:HAD family phosphatase [Actinomycetospora endophytica]|uniref:HAD family phosphatase n=1 Tax=Actinomycetospora endophytica TaxID=2291215 RepID=A0ABS8P1C2_9PSEU|nr:HAD family phosphatase [Actinomycetospora endophytica]MCD2192047.1 HAD family phosphatase [Actinomycetospora endophytica]